MRNIFLIVPALLVFALVPVLLSASALASEHEEANVGEEVTELTEQERQALLAEISRKLEEVERELLRLSLIVQKMALEQQALALQEQLERTIAGEVQAPEAGPVALEEPAIEEEAAAVTVEETPVGEGESEIGAITLEEESSLPEATADQGEEEEEERGGFLAALGPVGNLGTPEFAALAILIFLVVFMVARRLRERGMRPAQTVPTQGTHPGSQPTSLNRSEQAPFDEPRQELKDRVAWE